MSAWVAAVVSWGKELVQSLIILMFHDFGPSNWVFLRMYHALAEKNHPEKKSKNNSLPEKSIWVNVNQVSKVGKAN